MEPYDLEQIVREEMQFIGLPDQTPQQDPAERAPGLVAAAGEIELAVDGLPAIHPYNLPMRPEYMFDPEYTPDNIVLVVSCPMLAPLFGPHADR